MKRTFFSVFVVFMTGIAHGQVAKWLIEPAYDEIHLANGEDLIITDSLQQKSLWTFGGKCLAKTQYQINTFNEGYSVTTERGSSAITGFLNKKGKFVSLSGCNVAYSFPSFSDGYLLVKENSYYRFVNVKGDFLEGQYTNAYPYINGYASCKTYRNLQKQKDPYNLLLNREGQEVFFSYNGRLFDKEDLDFISSVNDENIGVVIVKQKLFFFNGEDGSLSPVYDRKGETNIKNQARLERNLSQSIQVETDTTLVLYAKCGKTSNIKIRLSSFLVPLSIQLGNEEYIYKRNESDKKKHPSSIRMTEQDGKFGVNWDSQEILPPQLDALVTCFDDKAFVKMAGKYGMLKVLPEARFRLSINKGDDIAFRHQKFETKIRLDMPNIISAYGARIEVDSNSGCDVDLTSGEQRDTEYGNYIQYNCVLNIPDSLPDEMYGDKRNEVVFPTQILYEGLRSPIIPFKVKAWHYKYFNVDINSSETSISQGVFSFTFNINAERDPGETVYPTSINIQTDSLKYELEKISETRYKCKVYSLREGTNNIIVQIIEQGCPPASFPFEITYVKPAAKTRNKPAVKENVVIKKKNKIVTSQVPHLDI